MSLRLGSYHRRVYALLVLCSGIALSCAPSGDVDANALADAIERGDAISVGQLVGQRGAVLPPLVSGQGAMQRAAELGDTVILRTLVARGAGVDTPDLRAEVPLMAAVRAHQRLSVRWLLAADATVDPIPVGRLSPLAVALLQQDLDIANDLLAAGADLDRPVRRPTGTVRDMATAMGLLERLRPSRPRPTGADRPTP